MIAAYLFRNPRILLLLVVVIVVAGVSSWFVLPQLEDPVLGRRVGLISTVYPGANAGQVESLVTIPLEESLQGLADVKQVRSNSQSGISNVVVELQGEVYDVDPVWSVVRDRIADAKSRLPAEARASQLDIVPLKAYAAIVALIPQQVDAESDNSDLTMARALAKKLRRELLTLSGTETVDVFGDPGEEYSIEIAPAQLATLQTSVAAIAAQVRQQQTKFPAGRISEGGASLPLSVFSEPDAVRSIEQSTVTFGPRGEIVPLKEIAVIRRQMVNPADEAAMIDGRDSIVIGAMVNDSLRVDEWAAQLDEVLAEFQRKHQAEVRVKTLFSQRDHISQRMQTLIWNLCIGIAAVTVVVLLLMGWRSMLVVSAALPLSSLMVLAAMRFLEIPVHQMSVTGLIVALGLLIDNAIVIVEDVRGRITSGQSAGDAIVSGVRHLRMPLFGSTLTTALAFLPIATLPGPPGEFVGTIAVSVILAITSSFLLAMTVIPAMISLLRIQPGQRGFLAYGLSIEPLRRIYEATLRGVFRVPIVGVVLGCILPVLGFLASRELPEQFFPPSDRLQIQIEVEQPARDSLVSTQQTAEAIRNIVKDEAEVLSQNWFVGRSAPTFFYNVVPRRRGTPFYAQAFLDLQNGTDIQPIVRQLQDQLSGRFPQSRILVRQLEQGPPFDAPVEVRVIGEDAAVLQDLGNQLRVILSETPQVLHTRADLSETIPQLEFDIDEDAAANAGLTAAEISAQLYTSLVGADAGSIADGGEDIPIRIRLMLDDELKYEQVSALPLVSLSPGPPKGTSNRPPTTDATEFSPATLANVGIRSMGADVGAVVRIDGRRVNEVKAYTTAGVLPSTIVDDFKQRIEAAKFELPEGYAIEFGGESEQRSQAVNRLIANGTVLFALMLLTLVLSFGSFRCAAIIAAVGGLSVGLGPLTLAAFGMPFGFMAIVGTMGLVGVAINDSIVVLAAIRADEAACTGNIRRLSEVVSHCTRHIIATTLTTVVGFLPLILAGGGFWPPLAVTIAGAIGAATMMALYTVPSMHLLLFRWQKAAKASE